MNKRILIVVLTGFLLSGCANNSSPEKVLQSFLGKMKEKKVEEASLLATQNSQEFFREIKEKEAAANEKNGGQISEEAMYANKKQEESFKVGKAKITGNFATVIVTYIREAEGEPSQFSIKYALEKENGDWKVMMIPTPRLILSRDSDNPFNSIRQY